MELHESLAQLARDHGHALFGEAEAFRGALDDYLDEGTASIGTINLLTDAVRLGALEGMITMLDSGARVDDAVDTAGRRLARDRGSGDVRGSQWAVAVLGYALGRVPLELATRLRPDATTAAPAPAPEPPVAPPPPPPAPAQWQLPGQPVAPPPAYQAGPGSSYGVPGRWGPPPKKSRTGLVVGLVAVAVVLVVGGIVAAVALSAGDEGARDNPTTAESSVTDTPETESPATPSAETEDTGTVGPLTVQGDGYRYELPSSEWTDVTAETPDETNSIDTVVVLGDALNTGRGSILVEIGSAYGQTHPADLEQDWKDLIARTTGATPVDIGEITIGGLPAIGVSLEWTNANDFEVRQVAYLVVSGDSQYSITASFRQGDSEFEEIFHDVLDTWAWE